MSFYKVDKWSAVAIVVANMVGTGVFTSLGFQLLDIQNAWSILFLWLIGGLIALSGAFTYAEIGTFLIRNGGEYHYLSKLFHPSLGFLAGFVSVIVGFAAPIAAASVAFGKYFAYTFFTDYSYVSQTLLSLFIVILITIIHLFSMKFSVIFQKSVTVLKVVIILSFVVALFYPNANTNAFEWKMDKIFSEIFSSAFAVSLIYVSYAYSGWNAAAYMAGEIENPQKNLSFAIVAGTIIVVFLYVLLNFCFLYSTPVPALKSNVEVGVISAHSIFGNYVGKFIGLLISLLLVSTISSMLLAAPRVLTSMGDDFSTISVFSAKNKYHSPYIALLFISAISIILIITSSFQWLINFIGITLIVFTILTAFGIFILRTNSHYQSIFKVPFFPFTTLFFIVMNIWILIYVSKNNFSALLTSVFIILTGLVLYYLIRKQK